MLSDDEERRVRTLLAARGADDSLGYFAPRRDKAGGFSPAGKSAAAAAAASPPPSPLRDLRRAAGIEHLGGGKARCHDHG